MDPFFFKQMLQLNKAAFDSAFHTMALLQEQAEKMTEAQLSQAEWLPEKGREAVRNWLKTNREGRESFKEAADAGFQYVEEYLKTI